MMFLYFAGVNLKL
jgi:signal transduction histidine kinase